LITYGLDGTYLQYNSNITPVYLQYKSSITGEWSMVNGEYCKTREIIDY